MELEKNVVLEARDNFPFGKDADTFSIDL